VKETDMTIRTLLCALALFALPFGTRAAEGLPGATVKPGTAAEREAQRRHWCADDPERCRQLRARAEACKADPQQCRAEREARREQWCKDNPEKCRERQARREACQADPAKCRAERRAQREQWCADNPERCRQMKARLEERRAQCEADPARCAPGRERGPRRGGSA
jgi:hypothetical protein